MLASLFRLLFPIWSEIGGVNALDTAIWRGGTCYTGFLPNCYILLGLVCWAGRVENAGWCVVPRPQFLNELVLFPF